MTALELSESVSETATRAADLLEHDACTNVEALFVIAYLLLKMVHGSLETDDIPPVEALDECLAQIRQWVTDSLAVMH